MYEFIRKKYIGQKNTPELLKLEDLVTEEERKEFMNKMQNIESVENVILDEKLDSDIKKSKIYELIYF